VNKKLNDSQLLEAVRRYEVAAEPGLTYLGTAWEKFEVLLSHARRLENIAKGLLLVATADDFLIRLRRAIRILRTSPLDAADPFVGMQDLVESDTASRLDGDLAKSIVDVQLAAAALLTEPHPAFLELNNVINGGSKVRFERCDSICIVTTNQLVGPIRERLSSLITQTRSITVLSKSEARFAGRFDLCVVLGSPENLVDWRIEPSDRPREISWIFTAPLAKDTLVLSWPGNNSFDPDDYEPFEGAGMFDARVVGPSKFRIEVSDDEVAFQRPRPAIPDYSGEETFDCLDFALPDNRWISFGLEVGQRATRIVDDEFGLEIEERVAPRSLRRGDVLVVAEGGGSDSKRQQLCFEWVKDRKEFSGETAMKSVNEYRAALRAKRWDDSFVRQLARSGMNEQYIRGQLLRAWSANAMAPKERKNFDAIVDALGIELDTESAWKHITALRGGFIAAGTQIVEWLKEAIVADQSWLPSIEQRQIAIVEVPDLGRVKLAPILNVADELVKRPVNRMGDVWG